MQPVSHNTVQLKKMNVELVKNTLKSIGVGTKASIARLTGLSVATCGTILNELLRTGEVTESDPEETSGGRPAKLYRFNADYGCVACLFIRTEGGIHSIAYAVANLIGEVAEEKTLFFDSIDEGTIYGLLDAVVEQHSSVKAIGIGIPGVVQGGSIGICDVAALAGKPLGPRLKERYGVEITIDNDMNLTVYGFYTGQNFEEQKTFAVVTFPKDHYPGAGFIVDGRILNGTTNFGGEVSYLPFGMSREEQLKLLRSGGDGFVPLVVKTLVSVIAILNPAAIALTGDLLRPDLLQMVSEETMKEIPKAHMPELFIQKDTRQEYVNGLISVTLESLTYSLQLVEKR
ncbi:ROK family protein [Paenibacillus arenilitoris]|uniref:ROK family protein n=1 Tax=Paenibacillus arenilitoris TaxID=2772299 RepID=A0A927H814_9BACL|nr:ROK family protein [Paenibacillus arenilitoris]MBD2871112.1 ROK family protein [Paenibacillus arenilitoris]